MLGLIDMHEDDPCGLGGLLERTQIFRIGSALSDRCASIAAMFNVLDECHDVDIVEACQHLVYLQCHPHIARNVGKKAYNTPAGKQFMQDLVHCAHMSRTEQHFDMQCTVGLAILRCVSPAFRMGDGDRGLACVQVNGRRSGGRLVRQGVLRGALEWVVDRCDC